MLKIESRMRWTACDWALRAWVWSLARPWSSYTLSTEPKVLNESKYSMPWVRFALGNFYFHLPALSKFKSSIFLLTFLDQLITPPHCLSTSTVCLQIISTRVTFVSEKTSLAQFKPIFGKSNTVGGLVKVDDCDNIGKFRVRRPSPIGCSYYDVQY